MSQNPLLGTEEIPVVAPTSEEKTMALLAHVLTFVSNIIAPLIIYLVKKDDSSFVAFHAKESLNFQITMLIAFIVSILLWVVIIGFFITWLLGIADLVLVIVATMKASEGKLYRYPFSIRFIR